MYPKKFIIEITRKAFRHLAGCFTNKIGEAVGTNDAIKKILVCRPNHRLGSLLLLQPLVQELESTFPNSKIDLQFNCFKIMTTSIRLLNFHGILSKTQRNTYVRLNALETLNMIWP